MVPWWSQNIGGPGHLLLLIPQPAAPPETLPLSAGKNPVPRISLDTRHLSGTTAGNVKILAKGIPEGVDNPKNAPNIWPGRENHANMKAELPENEAERIETLHRYNILDTPPETGYDDLVHLASEICGMPIAAISLVDKDRQWFKSILGLEVSQTSRDAAFCAHAILDKTQPLIVEDATLDPRFADNILVTDEPGIRFYAGTPLVMSDGNPIGTLCVIDKVPRTITAKQRKALEILGREVVAQVELRNNIRALERSVVMLARTEAQLRQTQQQELDLKDEFVSHVSHELRSPLTPIYQFATILRDEIGGPLTDEQKEFADIIVRNSEQLGGMIGDLLEVTRAQTGKLTVDRRRIRIEDIVVDVVRSRKLTAQGAGLTLTSEFSGHLPGVIGDAARVRQVLANLIENAMKFTPAGGAILDIENGIGCNSVFHSPAEEHVVNLAISRFTLNTILLVFIG